MYAFVVTLITDTAAFTETAAVPPKLPPAEIDKMSLARRGVERHVARHVDVDVLRDPRLRRLREHLDVDTRPHAGRPADTDRAGEPEQIGGVAAPTRRRRRWCRCRRRRRSRRCARLVVWSLTFTTAEPATPAVFPGTRDGDEEEVAVLAGLDDHAAATVAVDHGAVVDRRLDRAVADEDRRRCADAGAPGADRHVARRQIEVARVRGSDLELATASTRSRPRR